MGEPPPPFDVLAWNDDATATPAAFALQATRILDGPDPGRPVLHGAPADLAQAGCDSFHVAGYTKAPGPDEWLATATFQHGSWWPRWADWLTTRSGGEQAAPAVLGNRRYPPLGPAPGGYALQ